jgi:hypothetical protein
MYLPIGPPEPTEETQMTDQIEIPEIETEDEAAYAQALAVLTSTSTMAERPEA